jgi:hypothetical protein
MKCKICQINDTESGYSICLDCDTLFYEAHESSMAILKQLEKLLAEDEEPKNDDEKR